MYLEPSSSTDRKDSQRYNKRLPQRCVRSVVNHPIAKGVAVDRLEACGYSKEHLYVVTKGVATRLDWLPERQKLTAEWVGALAEE